MAETTARVCRVWDARAFPGGDQAFKKNILLMPGHFDEFDPFLMMAEDWMQKPGGFRDHPHRGFETMTLILDGACRHNDNKGNSGTLNVGDVQWMTAGRGVVHSEMPEGAETCHLLQLWINLPAAAKMMPPRYQDIRGADMPLYRAPGVSARVISGTLKNAVSPTLNVVNVLAFIADISPGYELPVALDASWTAFAYVLSGAAQFAPKSGDSVAARSGQVALLKTGGGHGEDCIRIIVDAGVLTDTRVVFFAGEPVREPVFAEGPFVMNTHEEIVKAHRDYVNGLF